MVGFEGPGSLPSANPISMIYSSWNEYRVTRTCENYTITPTCRDAGEHHAWSYERFSSSGIIDLTVMNVRGDALY